MSDLELGLALDALEQLVLQGTLDPETLAAWQMRFDAALATADRGAGWADLVARAHALSGRLDVSVERLSAQRDELRKQLDLQARGARALKGYRPS